MKNYGFTIIFICFLSLSKAYSQSSKKPLPPSDAASGYTYNYDKVFAQLAHEAVTPSATNSAALTLVKMSDFPKFNSANLTAEDFDLIRKWMENHPNQIIEAYKNDNQIVTPFNR